MADLKLTDTFPAFLSWWQAVQTLPLEDQIESWAQTYLARWPELLAVQIADYAEQGLDWRQVARDRVFPHLAGRLSAMREAHRLLKENVEPVYTRAQQVLGFEFGCACVIYVGIGCGAGWATTFARLPAILFGLENIAECGWTTREAITGLIAHEIGHLVHHRWREEQGKRQDSGPWWQLYEEGFAQRCETSVLGPEAWHQATGQPGWLDWCRCHRSWLAAEFIGAAGRGEPATPFFGSWSQLRGWRETGYFLGHEAISVLEQHLSLQQIALLEDVEACLRPVLEEMTTNDPTYN